MTEIEKLIEKACANYCEKVDSVYNEKDVFKAGASFILHQNRWRKVEEELPEYYEQVLVKSKDSESVICAWLACMDNEEFKFTICGTDILIPIDDVDEWKPIT